MAEPVPAAAPVPAQERMVTMRAPDGREFEVPASNMQAAMDADWEPVTSLAEDIATGAEGFARGVTLGISDAVQAVGGGIGTALGENLADEATGGAAAVPRALAPGLGAPAVADERQFLDRGAMQDSLAGIRTREAASPVLSTSTEIAGAVLPALLTGGTSTAAQAARFTPAGAASLLGARVQAHLAGKAATGALGRIGALAAGGATENAAQSATTRIVDDLIAGDFEISAERMLSGLGGVIQDAALGALTGGVIGGAIEGAGKAYRAGQGLLARRAAGKAAQAADGAAAPVLAYDLTLEPTAAAESAGPLLAKDLPSLADNTNSSLVQAARGSVDGFEDVQQGAVRAIRDDYDEFLKLRAEINGNANVGTKRAEASRFVTDDSDTIEAARANANAMLDEVDGALFTTTELDGYKAALQDGGGLTAFKRIGDASQEARALINTALDEGRIGDAFMVMDDFKRIVGRGQKTPNSVAKYKIRDWYDRIVKPAGEDEAAWGELAVNQKRVNPAWTASIGRDNDDLVQQFTRTSGERSVDPWENLEQSNSQAIGSLLNSLGTAESEATEKALRLQLRAAAVDAQTRAQVWGSPADIARAQKMTAAVERIESRMNAVAFAKKDKKAWEKVMKYAPGTAGGVLQGVAKLGQITLTPIQRMADAAVKQQQAVEKAAKSAAGMLLGSAATRALVATVTVNRVRDAVGQAQALQDPQSPESGRLRQAVLELAQDDPAFAMAMEAKQRQQAAFLADKAGPSVDTADPFAPGPALRDPVQQGKLTRYVAAVDDPGAALERVAHGVGSPEDLETLQTLYPRLYAVFVARVEEQVRRTRKPPTLAQRQQLHRATGIPLAREQQPEALAWLQTEGNAATEPLDPSSAPKRTGNVDINADEHYGPRSDQIVAGD